MTFRSPSWNSRFTGEFGSRFLHPKKDRKNCQVNKLHFEHEISTTQCDGHLCHPTFSNPKVTVLASDCSVDIFRGISMPLKG